MNAYTFTIQDENGIAAILVSGYFNDEAGNRFQEILADLLGRNRTRIIVDFAGCDIINSPGVAALLEASFRVNEDFQGCLVLSALKPVMREVLELAAVLPNTETAPTLEEARAALLARKG